MSHNTSWFYYGFFIILYLLFNFMGTYFLLKMRNMTVSNMAFTISLMSVLFGWLGVFPLSIVPVVVYYSNLPSGGGGGGRSRVSNGDPFRLDDLNLDSYDDGLIRKYESDMEAGSGSPGRTRTSTKKKKQSASPSARMTLKNA